MFRKWLLIPFLATSVAVVFCTEAVDVKKQLHSCIHNCAICVKVWEVGLYNGRRCAKRCLRNSGRRLVDPDCTKEDFFNYNAEVLRKYQKRIKLLNSKQESL